MSAPWCLLVDAGPPDTWPLLRQRLAALAPDGQVVDVAVVTHIDSDHIGGMVPLLADPVARAMLGDVWFNGEPHLPKRPRSVGQGEEVVADHPLVAPGDASISDAQYGGPGPTPRRSLRPRSVAEKHFCDPRSPSSPAAPQPVTGASDPS